MVFIWTDRAPICVQGIWCIPFAFPAYVFTGYPCWTRNPPFLIFKELFWLEALFCNTHLHHSIFKEQRNFCGREEARTPESPPWQGGILTNWTTVPYTTFTVMWSTKTITLWVVSKNNSNHITSWIKNIDCISPVFSLFTKLYLWLGMRFHFNLCQLYFLHLKYSHPV